MLAHVRVEVRCRRVARPSSLVTTMARVADAVKAELDEAARLFALKQYESASDAYASAPVSYTHLTLPTKA